MKKTDNEEEMKMFTRSLSKFRNFPTSEARSLASASAKRLVSSSDKMQIWLEVKEKD